jgi:hypothetical protein
MTANRCPGCGWPFSTVVAGLPHPSHIIVSSMIFGFAFLANPA